MGVDDEPDHGGAGRRRPPARARRRRHRRAPRAGSGVAGRVPPHRGHARAPQERGPARAGLRPGAPLAARAVAARDRRADGWGPEPRGPPDRPTTSSSPARSPTPSWPSSTGGPAPSPTCRSPRATGCRRSRPCAPASPTVVSDEVPSVHDLGAPEPAPARIVDPLDVDDIAAGLAAVLTDDALRAELAAPGRGLRVGADLARRRPRPRRAVAVAAVTDEPLALSLDVSAVPARPGGAGYYTMALARGLAGRDDVGLTLVARRGDEERWRDAGRRRRGARRGARLAAGPAGLRAAPPRVPCCAPLGVQVHHGPHYTMPARSPVPCAVTIHDCTFFDHPEWHLRSKAAFFRRAIRRAARHAGVLVCVSQVTEDRLRAVLRRAGAGRGGAARGRPRAVHARASRPRGRTGPCSRALGVPVDRPLVAFVGTLEPRKGVVPLVAAFDQVADAHPDAVLVLGGQTGWGMAETERALAAARHPERIVRTGYLPDEAVPALLRQAVGRGLPGARGGVRAARPRGAGLRRAAGDDGGHGDGGDGRGRRAPRAARRRRRAGRRARARRSRRAAPRPAGRSGSPWRGSGPGRRASRCTCGPMRSPGRPRSRVPRDARADHRRKGLRGPVAGRAPQGPRATRSRSSTSRRTWPTAPPSAGSWPTSRPTPSTTWPP